MTLTQARRLTYRSLNLEVPESGLKPRPLAPNAVLLFLILDASFPLSRTLHGCLWTGRQNLHLPHGPPSSQGQSRRSTDWQVLHGERAGMMFPAVQGTAGPLPGHETSTLRPSISHESQAQMLCAASHKSPHQRRLQSCSHLGNVLLFLSCVPLCHKHYMKLKRSV